ncbi:WD40-repeat-containing domain protein [Neohortaea acidophila]|uniref:WD40-repeat-containing domain protein n=1 Tax=Neohortaea acidophila TaxID=245834 RepID=A0A6A6PM46_9PEZI|nr:WD40-repeat-containing domain protein [Neohortaea acidophila]KAF2481062.1 WD40-repeat-containing domain protein [Neohortaea acidophila]
MANVTGKRKRQDAHPSNHVQTKKTASTPHVNGNPAKSKPGVAAKPHIETSSPTNTGRKDVTIQIVTGSYERALHGTCATIQAPDQENVTFADNFLFAAHNSSIRCLALSPSSHSGKRFLATGGSDERINLYSLSTAPPPSSTIKASKISNSSLVEPLPIHNPLNRSLGNLVNHDRAITALHFPIKSKLFSAAEDNTIAISRARDWTVLSSIKAPIPKPQGRPSGDTAGPGEFPAGINDFAIHPSQKLMLSVGRGEKCMRLWNLMTGKKAGVLSFERDLLAQVGEGKHGSGEGRKVLWDEHGENYVIAFERGAVVFGIDSRPKAIIKPSPPTKLHALHFLPPTAESQAPSTLAVSTEDGRILFFDTSIAESTPDASKLPLLPCNAQLGGSAAGFSGRIKDFEVLTLPLAGSGQESPLAIITGSSDGAIRLWTVPPSDLAGSSSNQSANDTAAEKTNASKQLGKLVGTLETGNRITCLGAFVMDGTAQAEVDADAVEGDSDSEEGK